MKWTSVARVCGLGPFITLTQRSQSLTPGYMRATRVRGLVGWNALSLWNLNE